MIRTFFILLACLLPGMALSQPAFTDRADALDTPHIYGGGWEHFVGGGVAVFDCNGDAKPDIFASGGENPTHLYINQVNADGWQFATASFDPGDHVVGAYPLDFDSDGVMDLFVLRVGPNHIYKGHGDCTFTRADTTWGFTSPDRWSTAFSATWEPGQTWPTLAIGNYVDRTDPEGPFGACDTNALYHPNAQGYAPPTDLTPGFCALSILFSDWSRSGHADLRLSNDRHYYVTGGSEQMFRLDENRFLDEADGWQPISIWGMGIASQDITGDGRPDVFLTSMADQLMQLSTNTGFTAAPFAIGTYAQRPFLGDDGRPSTGWHAAFGDVDNDGRADLFIAKGNVDQMPSNAMADPNNLLMQSPDGTFHETAEQAGVATTERSRGAALTDLDGDGRLDLVVLNRRAPLELYQNTTTQTGHWLAVTPRQTDANSFAIGAWVELRDDAGRVQTQELTIGGGHAGGVAGPTHFGLGDQSKVDIRVIWPDGTKSDWAQVEADQSVELWRAGDNGFHIKPAQ